jgi:hypothetical protein
MRFVPQRILREPNVRGMRRALERFKI